MEPNAQTNVLKALLAARREFAPVVKRKDNQHLRTKYADLAGFLDAVTPALLKHGLVLLHRTECDADQRITLVTELCHAETGERIVSRYPIHSRLLDNPKANDLQVYGSAISYARRYAGMAILGIAAEGEDDDGHAAGYAQQKAAPPAERAAAQKPPAKPTEAELEATRVEIGNCDRLADLTRLYEGSPPLVREALKGDFTRRKEQIREAAQARKEARNGQAG